MSQIVVVVERHADGTVNKHTLELLTLAGQLGEPVAVVLDSGTTDGLAEHGAAVIARAVTPDADDVLVAGKAHALAAAVQELKPAVVLVPATLEGKEIAGRLAVANEAAVITDAVSVAADGAATQSVFAGGWTLTGRAAEGLSIITVKPNTVAPQAASGAGELREITVGALPGRQAKITAVAEKAASGRPELGEANIVVSGGRGTNGDFAAVEEFADSLGAAVGASRAAVDAGWYPHGNQVGQTGKQVSPQLYVACGISGAIQHRAGMQTSKTIVAVNTDPEAPIFELADFGVVGDLFTVLPQATQEIRQRKG